MILGLLLALAADVGGGPGLATSVPDQRVIVFEGDGHFAMETHPKRFADAVGDFLLGADNVKP